MRALKQFSEAHPVLSMLAGWLVLLAVAMALLPSDPQAMDQVSYRSTT
jgi:hypothetical protein